MEPMSEAIAELRQINARLKRQNSLWHMLFAGLMYGIGFFIGSAIIASILIAIFSTVVAHIPWIQNAIRAGMQFRS